VQNLKNYGKTINVVKLMERLRIDREILVAGSYKAHSEYAGSAEIPDPQKKSKNVEFRFLIFLFILETNDSYYYHSGRYSNLVSISKNKKKRFYFQFGGFAKLTTRTENFNQGNGTGS
jgi:hypothetical protein